jgi:phosphoenolpyruvate carboxykinase (GTP)
MRVLKWMLDRIEDRAATTETPIGNVPAPGSLLLDGLSISADQLDELLRVERDDWVEEEQAIGEFFAKFGERLPEELQEERLALAERLMRSAVPVK